MAAATNQARTSGQPAAAGALTTETQQVTAQPHGGYALSLNAQPVRTQQAGKWVPVDTTLRGNTDGSVSPAATAYGTVRFSGGGQGPLATSTSGATTYSISWPSPLPSPTVSGSTATYASVLPGVDLRVSATAAGGFSDVLVVHDATAAKNPGLATLTLATSVTGGQVRSGSHGGVLVTGNRGGLSLEASTPIMWDSNTTIPASAQPRTGGTNPPRVAPDPSDAGHPGLAARQSLVATHTTPTSLALTPDAHLLTGPHTVFPVYIDPTFNWHPTTGGTAAFDEVKQGWPCTNTSFFNNSGASGDYGQLGVGYNAWDSCFGIERAYYQWQLPTVIWGAHIGNVAGQPGATVNVSKVYSASCSTTSTDWLHWSGGIGSGTTWNNQPGPGAVTGGSVAFAPSYNANCTGHGAVAGGFDVTGQIAQSAADHYSQFTVALTGNESSGNVEFSRFADNPTLQIFYNLIPNTPGANQLNAVTGSDNAGCAVGTPYPYIGKTITTNTPVLNAVVSDPDNDPLQANFRYWVEGQSTNTGAGPTTGSGTTAQFSLPPSFVSALTNGQVVDWQVQVTDGQDWSGWSPTCHFIAEPTAPSAPSISSADGKYPGDGTIGAASGTPGQFTMAATSNGVTSIVKGLDQTPPASNPPSGGIVPFTGGSAVAPAARWKLGDGTGTTAADSAGTHPATLFGGAAWATDGTRGTVLTLDGSTGYAQTTTPGAVNAAVLNTGGNFTVSAWVNIATLTSAWQTFVIQQGSQVAGLYLEYDGNTQKWSFSKSASDVNNPIVDRAESSSAAVSNTWTHLAGVYNSSTGAMTLYVNGAASGSATDTSPWNATGQIVIGRGWFNGATGNFVHGSISDVQVYQTALSPSQVAQINFGGAATPIGRWRLLDGTGTTAADGSGNNHPATLTGGYTWNTTPTAGVTFNGSTGYAATSGPVLDTSSSFTVSAWVNLAGNSGYQDILTQQGTNVGAFYLEYASDQNRWSFVRFPTDSTAGVVRDYSTNAPALNTWTYLTGVYDATTGAMSLYVNGTLNSTATDPTGWKAAGPLVVGHGWYGGAANNYLNGAVTDVQTYQSILSDTEISQQYASATLPLTPRSPGPHTLYGYTADAAGDVSGYQSYRYLSAKDPNDTTTCTSWAACLNSQYGNTAISPDTNHGLGNLDGTGNSISATDLTNAGWTSGGQVAVNGATFTLPQYGAGQPDNVLAANQTITYNQPISPTGASALEFLTTSSYVDLDGATTPGAINGDTTAPYVPKGTAVAATYCFDSTNPTAFCAPSGIIKYTDGTTQTYYLTVPDWVIGPGALATVTLPHENQASGQISTNNPRLYAFAVPVTAGKTIASVQLPDVSTGVATYRQALHIFGMSTRDTTAGTVEANGTTAATPAGQTWTGAWASPTEGNYNYVGTNFTNQTFRIALKPSLNGNTVRVKLDDAIGTSPLSIGHVTIAASTTTNTPSSTPAATPVNLTFGGATPTMGAPLRIPQGGMVYSDPLNFTVTANQYLLVSFTLANSVPWLVEHSWVDNAVEYTAAVNSGDNAADTTGTPFTASGSTTGYWTDLVTNLDVTTNGVPTQAVLGDGLTDSWDATTAARYSTDPRLVDDIAAAGPTTTSPYGTIAEGIRSNPLMTDNPTYGGTTVLGPSALTRIDRDILDQPGLSAVVVNEGLQDTLNGRTANDLITNGYTELLGLLQDSGITTIAVGQTPCDGYTGNGATPNDPCTSTVDTVRTTVNQWLSTGPAYIGPWSTPPLFYLNPDPVLGVPDTTNGETKLNPTADAGDHLNLTTAAYGALTNAYLSPQDTWPLDDGTGATIATDAASNDTNPYLVNYTGAGSNPATLSTTGTSWTSDATHGTVLTLDGTTGHAATTGPVLNTAASYTISAWVRLSATTQTGVIASQIGTTGSAFTLRYNNGSTGTWSFTMTASDGQTDASGLWANATTTQPAGTWTHIAGTYNAVAHTMTIYINGQPISATPVNTTTWNASGAFVIGASQTAGALTNYFPGEISNLQVWNYTLGNAQINALYQQGK